jgi:hypothetical protein
VSAPPIPPWLLYGIPRAGIPPILNDPEFCFKIEKPVGKTGQREIHWQSNAGQQTWAALCYIEEACIGGRRGGGKLSPLDSDVCTPKGFVKMGDLNIGDLVTDPTTGGQQTVIAVHPHPKMDIWRLTFDDGASLEVGSDHLWIYRRSNTQRPNTKRSSERQYAIKTLNSSSAAQKWDRYRVGKTSDLMEMFKSGETIRIPLSEPVIFTNRSKRRTASPCPYLVGLFLGDGHLHSASITTADKETITYLTGLGFVKSVKPHNNAVSLRAVGDKRRQYRAYFSGKGMLHHHSWEKFIPVGLKNGLLWERLDVLRGLLDTDGTVDARGRIYFISTSKQLAEDVQFIVRSLGGKARLRNRQTKFTNKHGDKQNGRPSYQVRIWHPKQSVLFNLSRKKTRCRDSWNGGVELSRELSKIEYIGKKEARCITVSGTYGVYLGNDFIVTHNSQLLLAKPALPNLYLASGDPAYVSSLNEPTYRALFLREEYQSMTEFVDQAVEFYKPFGGKPKGDPKYIQFPQGSRIYFNHLGDEEAFNKYKGWNLTFIGIEELTQIKTLKRYLKLLGSLRAVERVRSGKKWPALRTQIMSTTNPDGPGSEWVCDRFVEVPDKQGKIIPPNTPIWDGTAKRYKIFIPFPIEANPYLAEDTPAGQRYRSNLMAQDETTRKQWMDGDWHAGTSIYFSEYRQNGPVGEEEKTKWPWACHITKPVALKPWWYRWGSGDWGYDHPAAFHKGCRNEDDGRLHVYDEMQVRRVGSFEMGALLAKWWHHDLIALKAAGQDPQVTIFMGADAFSKDDAEKTKAQQMAAGIKEVLGPYGSLLLKYDETEAEAALRNPKYAAQLFERRRKELQGRMCIMLKPIYIERVTGWNYCREMLRFRTAVLELQTPEAREKYLKEVLAQEGREAYERHAADLRKLKPEVLPKMVIWDKCKQLDRFIKTAQRDLRNEDDPSKQSRSEDILKQNAIDGVGGDDSGESWRNLVAAYREIETTIPKSFFVNERIGEAQKDYVQNFGEELSDPTRLRQIALTQAALYEKANPSVGRTFTFPRAGSMRHRDRVN